MRDDNPNDIDAIKAEVEAELARMSEPLFTANAGSDEWATDACLNFVPYPWDTYAIGYKRAADVLVEYVAQEKRDQDTLVYPIAFLYRHYLELRLKELIRVSSKLLDLHAEIRNEHDLMKLWNIVRPNIETVWGPDPGGNLEACEARLRELNNIDPRSEAAFRYPENTKGVPYLKSLPHNINLGHLRDIMKGISHVLDGSSTGMGEYLDAKHEMMIIEGKSGPDRMAYPSSPNVARG